MYEKFKQIDTKELQFPETTFSRDIESRVFQSIALQCLAKIEGIGLLEGNFIDSLLGREVADKVKGIYVEQDEKSHSINMKIELNVAYGVCIPDKAEEIQAKVVEEISLSTGLHVGSVHLVFKNLIARTSLEDLTTKIEKEMLLIEKG